jgi:bacterioferritin-associated ferredoxin
MIVCSCYAVSEGTLREAAQSGLSRAEIEQTTGAGTDCGCCKEAVDEIVAAGTLPCNGSACQGCPHRAA